MKCKKVSYSKKDAKYQVKVRPGPGYAYFCHQHGAWHITRGIINEWVWHRAGIYRRSKKPRR